MSLFHKPLDQATFQDVEDFCRAGHPEGVILDYKEDFPKHLYHTLAAMANTHGGLILLGVGEDKRTTKPKLPLKGIEGVHLRDRVQSVDLDNIHPPVFPEVHPIEIPPGEPNAGRSVVLIRIHESDITPHTTDGGARTYIRAPGQNKPYDDVEAALGRVEWLLNRRQRSVELREQLAGRAEERFWRLLEPKCAKDLESWKRNMKRFTFHACPLYPYEPLATPRELLDWLNCNKPPTLTSGPTERLHFHGTSAVVAGGAREIGLEPPEGRGTGVSPYLAYYLELNRHGSLFHAVHADLNRYPNTCCSKVIDPAMLLEMIAGWIAYELKLSQWLGFEGLLRVGFSLYGTLDQSVHEEDRYKCPDVSVAVERTALVGELRGQFGQLLTGMHREWLEGFTYAIDDAEMEDHLRHVARLTPGS